MLSARNRFHGHGSLRYVFRNGNVVRSRLITIRYSSNPHRKHSRVAIVVSKKVMKSAVGRNRIRRRLYEIMRHSLVDMPPKTDIALLVFSSEVMTMPHEELRDAVRQLLTTAQLYHQSE